MRKFYYLIFLSLFLTGCATVSPNKLGISQSEWDQYSDSQREQLIENYHQAQRSKISHAKGGSSLLSVNIQDGKALMPPFTQLTAFQPISFNIREGKCNEKLTIVSAENPEQHTKLGICYQGGTLYMDPSPIDPSKADGSLQFPYMPIWSRGFTYPNVTSTGMAKLTNVNITVQEISH
ncbi:MAG TPA: hypothetical protein VHE99_09735 [Gammaproteobacteria bacterium]|nr:hypothetical protein [Gammaproteobacteria bacterium]